MIFFKSINDILYFIYTNENRSIIAYNLIDNKKINEIKKAHDESITNFRYYLDKEKKQDLILSTSLNNNLKLWRIDNWECLLNIVSIYTTGKLYSACFLILKNKYYFLTSNNDAEPIKVFNDNGTLIKEINDSKFDTNFIDVYYENDNSKIYILTANDGFVKSYDYNKNEIYHIYNDNDGKSHDNLRIKKENNLIKLIEQSYDGNIRIWNFHTGILLNKINTGNIRLKGMCLWNNDYLFVGCDDKIIKIVDMQKSKVIDNISDNNSIIIVLAKANIPKYGECLISQEYGNITKLWKIKLNN